MVASKTHPLSKLFSAGAHHIVAKPLKVASYTWQILRHPSLFAHTQISDEGESRLAESVKFFFSTFIVAFTLHVFSSPFALYDGSSEIRELVKLLLQIAIGASIIYFLLRMTCERLKVAGLMQIIIYIGSVYLLVGTIISIPMTYFKYVAFFSAPTKVTDIFGTELERCLTRESLVYWAVRGEMQLNLYNDLWHPDTWSKWAMENWHYFLIIPFSLIFARMVRAKYGGNLILIVLIGCLGCFVAETSVGAAEEWIIANYNKITPACHDTAVKEVSKKYSVTLIADQLEYKLGNELKKSLSSSAIFQDAEHKPTLSRKDQDFLLTIKLKPQPDRSAEQFHDWADSNLKAIYCSHNMYWEMLRKINYRLVVSIAQQDDALAYAKNYEPNACGS
jgi:hypothetical protein